MAEAVTAARSTSKSGFLSPRGPNDEHERSIDGGIASGLLPSGSDTPWQSHAGRVDKGLSAGQNEKASLKWIPVLPELSSSHSYPSRGIHRRAPFPPQGSHGL